MSGAAQVGLKRYTHTDEFGQLLGYRLIEVSRKTNTGKLGLTIRKKHLSSAGRVHGGVIAACFDVALGLAVFSTMDPLDVTSTVELKVNYLKPIHLGDELVFESAIDFRGKRLCVAHAYVYKNGERDPTGMSSGTYYVVPAIKTEREGSRKPKARGRA
jgi:uncharacterized protein (TIGR00369 family)